MAEGMGSPDYRTSQEDQARRMALAVASYDLEDS